MPPSAVPGPVFRLSPPEADPARCVYVDGVEPGFRCLSHWPGNATPAALKHDLSTGIALNWARLDEAGRERVLGPFDLVCNNHYDTDGVLAAFAVLRPEEALPRAEALLPAAATGDFASFHGPEALALDLVVMGLCHHRASPLAGRLEGLSDDTDRHQAATLWLIQHLPELLDDPLRWVDPWRGRHERILADVGRVERREGVRVEEVPEQDLALVVSEAPLAGVALHHAAGDRSRVLLARPGPGGTRYRFVYRVLSWFELVSRSPPPRVPLEPVVQALQAAEGKGPGRWWATDLAAPVAQLGYGTPPEAGGDLFATPDPEPDPPSRLQPEAVLEALLEVLQRGAG